MLFGCLQKKLNRRFKDCVRLSRGKYTETGPMRATGGCARTIATANQNRQNHTLTGDVEVEGCMDGGKVGNP